LDATVTPELVDRALEAIAGEWPIRTTFPEGMRAALLAAVPLGEDARFTLDKPTVEGWYWMNDQGSGIEVVRVFKRPGHDYLCIYGERYMGKRDFVAVARTRFQWCGPLPLPAPPSDAELAREGKT
jgi:hypothetical protein